MGTTKAPEQKPALDPTEILWPAWESGLSFFGETCDEEGRPNKVWLYHAMSTPFKRHVKVKGEANRNGA